MKIVFGIPVRSGKDDINYLNEILIPLLWQTVPRCKIHVMQTGDNGLNTISDSSSIAPFDNYRFGGTCCFDNLWHLMSHIVERHKGFDYFVRLDSDMFILNPDWWAKAEKDLQDRSMLLARCVSCRREPRDDIGPLSYIVPDTTAVYGFFMGFRNDLVDNILSFLKQYQSNKLIFNIADDAAISYLKPLLGFGIKNTSINIKVRADEKDDFNSKYDMTHAIKGRYYEKERKKIRDIAKSVLVPIRIRSMGGTSGGKFKNITRNWILSNQPNKILDVGAGSGTYAKLLPESRMDCIEIFEPYINRYGLKLLYNKVFVGNILEFPIDDYDLLILGDVLEHLLIEDAITLLSKIRSKKIKAIINVPFGYEQGEKSGNKWEAHLQSDLTADIMKERYPTLECLTCDHKSGVYISL